MLIQKQGWVVKKKLLVLVGFSAFACGASKLVKQVDVGMSNSWEHEEQRPNNYFFEQEPATVGAKKQRAHVVPSDRVEPEYAGAIDNGMNGSWEQEELQSQEYSFERPERSAVVRSGKQSFEQESTSVGSKSQRTYLFPADRVEPEYAGPTESDMNDSWDQDGAFNVPIDRTDRPSARRITVKPSI